jgi:hypothetical protein
MKAMDSDIKLQQAGFSIPWHQRGKLLGNISQLDVNCEGLGDQRSIKRLSYGSSLLPLLSVCYFGSAVLINIFVVMMCFCAMQLQVC